MEKKYIISKDYKFDKKDEIEKIFEKYYYFTVSEYREVLEMLNEIYIVKNINPLEILLKKEAIEKNSKKENTKNLIEFLKQDKSPTMIRIMQEIKKIVKKIQKKGIKINIPENLEGQGLQIVLDLKTESDVQNTINQLKNNEKEIKELIRIINRGD